MTQPEAQALQASQPTAPDTVGSAGRPSEYSAAVADYICARLADGETLTAICRTRGLPTRQTVHRWRMRNEAFDDQYMRAREIGMEAMSDDMLAIADDDTLDTLPDGSPNHASVGRARLQVDTRKFLLGKLAPRIYGDRVQHEHTGSVAHTVTMDDRERMRRLASFMLDDQRAGALIEGTASEPEPASPSEPASPASSCDGAEPSAPACNRPPADEL